MSMFKGTIQVVHRAKVCFAHGVAALSLVFAAGQAWGQQRLTMESSPLQLPLQNNGSTNVDRQFDPNLDPSRVVSGRMQFGVASSDVGVAPRVNLELYRQGLPIANVVYDGFQFALRIRGEVNLIPLRVYYQPAVQPHGSAGSANSQPVLQIALVPATLEGLVTMNSVLTPALPTGVGAGFPANNTMISIGPRVLFSLAQHAQLDGEGMRSMVFRVTLGAAGGAVQDQDGSSLNREGIIAQVNGGFAWEMSYGIYCLPNERYCHILRFEAQGGVRVSLNSRSMMGFFGNGSIRYEALDRRTGINPFIGISAEGRNDTNYVPAGASGSDRHQPLPAAVGVLGGFTWR